MSISDDLAAELEAVRQAEGIESLDAAAEALIARGLIADSVDHSAGWTDDELRRLIDEGEASGPVEAFDPDAVKKEVLRRYAARPNG